MSALRRLAVAGAFALPLSLVIAGPATAAPRGWPDGSWSSESSGTWAGIGGAGTTGTEEGSNHWGHHWSETETAVAGIGGAAVTHSGESGDDCDGYDAPAVARPHHVVGHPDPVVDEAPAVRPVHDNDTADDVGYAAESHSAGIDGASSAHVVSHAGEHHATYEAEKLTAGPYGASSEGAHSVAVPDYAGHHSWYTAAGVDGAEAHSVTAVADATGDDPAGWTVDHDVHHYFDYDQG